MFSHLSFDCVLPLLLLLTRSLEGVYVADVGQDAHLPCTYSPATPENLVPVCWGKGPCPVFECHSLVLSTDGRNMKYRTSSRYLLKRNVHKGDVTLTIEKVTLADSGIYCCRVQFPGPMNDQKTNLELVIQPARVTTALTPRRNVTAAAPRMLTTWGPGSVAETQTLETLYGKNQTEISTLADELQGMDVTTRTGLYIGVGVSAGLAFILISSALIFKWHSESKDNLQNSSLVTLANLPPPGLPNTAAEGMHSEDNVYIIEENAYEMEDPYEYEFCYVTNGQQS
uniref:Ig-like domain-containing protein n=1 Tax=Sus scrofa TaxID=9823 RepID=A0A8D0MJ99_PIG